MVADAVRAGAEAGSSPPLLGFAAEDRETFLGLPVRPVAGWLGEKGTRAEFVVAIGENRVRLDIARVMDGPFATVIHPAAAVAATARIGAGSVVLAGAVVGPDARIGAHAIVNTRAVVEHDCTLADGVTVAPGAVLCGAVRLDEGAFVGAGATVRQGLHLGAWSVAALGSAVVTDVAGATLVTGVPARPKGIRRADEPVYR